jgi:hypothetical protein
MKTVRGLGTTLLPEAAEKWAEKKGFLPTARDVELLGEATRESALAGATELGGDVLTAIAPTVGASRAATLASKGAGRTGQALSQMAAGSAAGAGTEATLAESGDVADAAMRGGAVGAMGEMVPRVAGKLLSKAVPSTEGTKALMQRGISPTLGQGADPNSWRGAALKGFEELTQVAPFSGAALRGARNKSANQLLEEAVRVVDPSVAKGAPQEMVEALRESTSKAYREPLDKVKLPFRKVDLTNLNGQLDTIAKRHSLDPNTTARIQSEVESAFMGVRGKRTAPLSVIENMADAVGDAGAKGAERQVRRDFAKLLRETVDNASEQAGKPLAKARSARAGYHVLDKAVPSGARKAEGISAERLTSALRKNDKRMGKMMTPELRQLAEEATGIEPAGRAFGVGSPNQVLAKMVDVGTAGATAGLAPAALTAYGMAQRTALPRLLLGDKATEEAFINALRNPSIRAAVLGAQEE